jgi:acylphosphatase
MKQTIHIVVSGRVQGVFYRATACKKARELCLSGIVRNTVSGTVEIIAQGKPENIDALVKWCWEGSTAADVFRVEKRKIDESISYLDFTIGPDLLSAD